MTGAVSSQQRWLCGLRRGTGNPPDPDSIWCSLNPPRHRKSTGPGLNSMQFKPARVRRQNVLDQLTIRQELLQMSRASSVATGRPYIVGIAPDFFSAFEEGEVNDVQKFKSSTVVRPPNSEVSGYFLTVVPLTKTLVDRAKKFAPYCCSCSPSPFKYQHAIGSTISFVADTSLDLLAKSVTISKRMDR